VSRENLTRLTLEQIPATPYDEVRPHLRSGDLLLCSGNAIFSRLIQRATRSAVSHAGILYRVDEIQRVLVLESVEGQGVRFVPLSKLVDGEDSRKYGGLLFVLRHRSPLAAEDIREASRFAFDELGAPYGWAKIAALAFRIAFGVSRERTRAGWICSELAAAWYARAGLDLDLSGGASGYMTPAELFRDPHFELIARIA